MSARFTICFETTTAKERLCKDGFVIAYASAHVYGINLLLRNLEEESFRCLVFFFRLGPLLN